MIIPKNDKEASSGMDVEKSLPPSGAVAVSEAEGSESSVSGDALVRFMYFNQIMHIANDRYHVLFMK